MVIVACNGVGTPRLLLNSASGRHPNGLANRSDQVGRNLMFHPYARIWETTHARIDAAAFLADVDGRARVAQIDDDLPGAVRAPAEVDIADGAVSACVGRGRGSAG